MDTSVKSTEITEAGRELFQFAWFPDFKCQLQTLQRLAMEEEWDYKHTPTGNLPILNNYIRHTFSKLKQEEKVMEEKGYAVFNTGLVTEKQEEIFAMFQQNKRKSATSSWYFLGWKKSSEYDLSRFSLLPECAHYFQNPADIIYDHRHPLRTNVDHIISDNRHRFPSKLRNIDDHQLANLLQGTIADAQKRVKRNYKTAIPQYYREHVQLLLPLCLQTREKADLALVVENFSYGYRASTILTLDMAVNNARLIARPDDEWLKP